MNLLNIEHISKIYGEKKIFDEESINKKKKKKKSQKKEKTNGTVKNQ